MWRIKIQKLKKNKQQWDNNHIKRALNNKISPNKVISKQDITKNPIYFGELHVVGHRLFAWFWKDVTVHYTYVWSELEF